MERCLSSFSESSSHDTTISPISSRQAQHSNPPSEHPNSRIGEINNYSDESANGDFGPPEDAFLAVIDTYFIYCQNQPYSFFHEANFRQRLSAQAVPKHLVLAVMATAVRFCSHPYFTDCAMEKSIEYANKSWRLIVSDCFTAATTAEVSAVQTVALLGLFDFTGMYILRTGASFCLHVDDSSLLVQQVGCATAQLGLKLAWLSGWRKTAD